MKEKIGFLLLLVLGVAGFLAISSSIEVPIYKTIETTIAKDTDGIYITLPEELVPMERPFYIYEKREQYVEKVKKYHVKVEEQAVYIENSSFTEGMKVSVDVETQRISLLNYILKEV